jgi:predicted nucleic acid-binding protein
MVPVAALDELLFFIERNKVMGKGIEFVDAHLLASAQLSRIPLWTSDGALKLAASEPRLAHEDR